MVRGIKQGACDSAILFALVIASVLMKLENNWKQQGMGIRLGGFGGHDQAFQTFFTDHFGHFLHDEINIEDLYFAALAFIDDLYLLASNPTHAQRMLDDVVTALNEIGLRINLDKSCWTMDKLSWETWGCRTLSFDGCLKTPVKQLTVLGSVISYDASEVEAFQHRISQSWKCYHKWKHIFETPGNLCDRLKLWTKTVWRSMVWGLQTCRYNQSLYEKVATTQKLMVRRFLRLGNLCAMMRESK